ncbi:MAG: flagellar hook-basal body complex protein FliE [Azospirillum brasilense]|nr:MAG: flagellar hook-basal body complex protein FliE [Azospirillum brasilense]
MSNVNFLNATNAYRDALRTAERILEQTSLPESKATAKTEGPSFMDMVGSALEGAADTGYKSEFMTTQMLKGKADLTDVVTAVANAEMALSTVVTVRDRVINAYQDIIKMPI